MGLCACEIVTAKTGIGAGISVWAAKGAFIAGIGAAGNYGAYVACMM